MEHLLKCSIQNYWNVKNIFLENIRKFELFVENDAMSFHACFIVICPRGPTASWGVLSVFT